MVEPGSFGQAGGAVEAGRAFMARPLTRLLGAKASKLGSLGLSTVADLLYNFPRRYEDPAKATNLSSLRVGEFVSVMAQVLRASARRARSGKKTILSVVVSDGERALSLTHFLSRTWQVDWFLEQYRPGRMGLFSGQVNLYNNQPQLVHPKVIWVASEQQGDEAWIEAGRPTPIYAANAQVESAQIQLAVRTLIDQMGGLELPDPLPAALVEEHGLAPLDKGLRLIHQPRVDSDWRTGRARFRFEEAFVVQTALARRRQELAAIQTTARPATAKGLVDQLDARLPFQLTDDQQEVGQLISQMLAQRQPMNQLLQGDVGSGKTVVALRAMLQVVESGGQAALLAPTEVLAGQHHKTIQALLADLCDQGGGGVGVRLLIGSIPAKTKDTIRSDIAAGTAQIVVGTHALLQTSVAFKDLGLVVVDEQHRFGVEQRDQLRRGDGPPPHLLVMTATPIPRTIAMTVFGDLGQLTLAHSPPGRPEVKTVWVNPDNHPHWIDRVWQRLAEEVRAGHRAFVVVPAIEPGEVEPGAMLISEEAVSPLLFGTPAGPVAASKRPMASVAQTLTELRARPDLAAVRFAPMHSRVRSEQKDQVMAAFGRGDIDALVTTTVIEVGIDVPAATTLVVLDADRFGLSQLHQLRGRIGRGSHESVCLLVSNAAPESIAAKRLAALAAHRDGFALAEIDLQTRHQGDILGTAQSGHRGALRLIDVTRDAELIGQCRQAAQNVVAADRDLANHPALAWAVGNLVGDREDFLERG
ncbi:MAG: ATP-dependent DNA helicase RecG [Micrococcales bacterium]|nr:ATP-dependent DNA helicase RecG [Micrococcales bacterium]